MNNKDEAGKSCSCFLRRRKRRKVTALKGFTKCVFIASELIGIVA